MRRGRIFIYLSLILVVVVAGAAIYWWTTRPVTPSDANTTQTAPELRYVEIVTAGQNIYPGTPITEAMLSSIQIPEDKLVEGLYTSKSDLVNMYAKYAISQGVPITESMVSVAPGNVNLPGSYWAPYIPRGLTAVSIPIDRLSSAAFGIRDGDYVNVIVTMLLVDIDPTFQSVLPNTASTISNPGFFENLGEVVTGQIGTTGGGSGRVEIDEELGIPFYLTPSEAQRPRLVTQMIMQNVQVLHVGTFPLPGEVVADSLIAPAPGTEASATPAPADETTTTTVAKPDIITLMVTPQDAVMLTYLVYSGTEITLTLRNPNDQDPAPQPDAAMLEYLLTQYNIPIPAKLPYALQPRLDELKAPVLTNDIPADTNR
jgi:pilus assembly protein CpaB